MEAKAPVLLSVNLSAFMDHLLSAESGTGQSIPPQFTHLPKYTFLLYLILHYIHLEHVWTEAADQKQMEWKEKKGETKMSKFTGQRHLWNYMTSQWKCMFVCVCFVCLDRCTVPSLGFCQWSKWVLMWKQIHGPCLISLCFSPHPSGPALHPFPLHWQHPKQPALITTHPSIRTLLRPARCPPLGR